MSADLGILVMRLCFGAAIAAHGAQKVFGWFGGRGLRGSGEVFEGMGFRPGPVFAATVGISEVAGGVLLALGLFTPLAGSAILCAMLVAMEVKLKNGFFALTDGIETAFLYAVAALGFILSGGGTHSLDARLGLTFLDRTDATVALLLLAGIAAAISVVIRRPPVSPT